MTGQPIVQGRTGGGRTVLLTLTLASLAIIYAPAAYLLMASFNAGRQFGIVMPNRFSMVWYGALLDDHRLVAALRESLWVGLATAVLSTPLGLSAALAYRAMQQRRGMFFLFMLFAMFIPGTIEGLGLSVILKLLTIRPSWATVVAGHLLWTLPFAFTVSLVGLAAVRPSMVAAARDLGAGAWRAFADVTLPLMRSSLVSSFLFAFLLSLNEYARAYYLVGRQNTLPLYMFGVMNSGASPTIYAFAGAVLLASFVMVGGVMLVMGWRRNVT